ncbi:hypothetical protein AB0G02_09185 [Actinosynnema sp. NPDC023658]|uniref:hypothetical protein n=1 Tax=Actinosynnema sp. NPDC023658 TaxID=3155465 RepID=UPI0033DF0084
MRTIVVALCAVLVAGCSAGSEAATPAPAGPAPDPAAVVRALLLPDQVTAPKGLVEAGEPVEGVRKLIECPDLPSAGQAVAGITATWTWSGDRRSAIVTQYSAVYREVSGKDVVKQARTASTCYRGADLRITEPQPLDEYLYAQDDLGRTTPFVDDRYSYCISNEVTHRQVCVAVQAKADKVVRTTIDLAADPLVGDGWLSSKDFAQAVTDRLVA